MSVHRLDKQVVARRFQRLQPTRMAQLRRPRRALANSRHPSAAGSAAKLSIAPRPHRKPPFGRLQRLRTLRETHPRRDCVFQLSRLTQRSPMTRSRPRLTIGAPRSRPLLIPAKKPMKTATKSSKRLLPRSPCHSQRQSQRPLRTVHSTSLKTTKTNQSLSSRPRDGVRRSFNRPVLILKKRNRRLRFLLLQR